LNGTADWSGSARTIAEPSTSTQHVLAAAHASPAEQTDSDAVGDTLRDGFEKRPHWKHQSSKHVITGFSTRRGEKIETSEIVAK